MLWKKKSITKRISTFPIILLNFLEFVEIVKASMKNKFLLLIAGFVLIAVLGFLFNSGFLRSKSARQISQNNKLQVTASFYPLYFFSSEIGGEKSEVKNITPSGSEPHNYDPSPQDIARIESGDIFILNGGVEAWGNRIKDNLKDTKVKIITAGEGLLTRQIEEEGKNQTDPHIWLDPQLAKKEGEKITEGSIAIDPSNSTYYQNNEQKLKNKLDKLDQDYKQGLQRCQSKDIITSHAAFGYLANRYGLNQVTVTGISPDEEPSAQKIADVAKFAKEHNVKYIFFESLVSPKLSETIANEVGARTMVLDPIEGISDDDIKQGKNYFTVMEDNLKNLQIALQCSK